MQLYLAPIHGMTNAYYRNSYHANFGNIDSYYAPFIGATSMRSGKSSLFSDILPRNNDSDLSVVPQILGNNSSDFHYFATHIAELGYEEINWNIGCPFNKVARKMKGSGLLPYADKIKVFLDYVCKEKTYDLSIKMRLGLNSYEEGLEVMDVLNDYPLKGIILHARTGSQLYSGLVDLDAFHALIQVSKHTITYNGDIYSNEDYKRIQARFPSINSFMIGRGALRNPFLPSEIKGIVYSEDVKLDKIRNFHHLIYDYLKTTLPSDQRVLNNMKEFWDYLYYYFDPSNALIAKIKACSNLSDYNNLIRSFMY